MLSFAIDKSLITLRLFIRQNGKTVFDVINNKLETEWGSPRFHCRQGYSSNMNSNDKEKKGTDNKESKDCPCCIHHKTILKLRTIILEILNKQQKESAAKKIKESVELLVS